MFAISKEETRYYLNGVFFDKAGILVATDGHRLAAVKPTEYYGELQESIIPRAVLESVIKTKTANKNLPLYACFDSDAGIVTVQHGVDDDSGILQVAAFPYKTIDGTFPDYRRVIPAADKFDTKNRKEGDSTLSAQGFNSGYMADFKAFGKTVKFFMNNNQGAPCIVRAKEPEFDALGVLMPMRADDITGENLIPDWLNPAPVEKKTEESAELPM